VTGTTTSVRGWALFVASAVLLTACGGTAISYLAEGESPKPAALMLSEKEARKLPKVGAVRIIDPEAQPTAPEAGAVAPRPVREAGPPGNPLATTLAVPPVEGTYAAAGLVEFGTGTDEFEFDYVIEKSTAATGGRRQLQVWDFGEDGSVEFTYLFTDLELLLLSQKTSGSLGIPSCDAFKPPIQWLKMPLEVEAKWDQEVGCKGSEGKTRQFSRVLRTEKIDIGGVQADAFVVETYAPGEQEGSSSTLLQWFVPKERLVVRFEQDVRSPQGSFYFEYQLGSLTPS